MNLNNSKYLIPPQAGLNQLPFTRSAFGLLVILFVWIFAWPTPAIAGILKIETQTTVEVAADLLKVSVTFTNKGTAPAYNLQVHLTTLGREKNSPVIPQLSPGQSDRALFETSVTGVKKGRYPLTIHVDFHDTNQYPFSALSGMTFHIDEDVNPNLMALAEDITLNKTGTLKFKIKNLGFKPRKILATLVLPKEFSTLKPKISLEIDQRSDSTLKFPVKNFSALPGANYPVFCYFEYNAEDTHYTAVARALVTIAKDENLFRRFRWLWISLTGILVAILVAVIIKERKKRMR